MISHVKSKLEISEEKKNTLPLLLTGKCLTPTSIQISIVAGNSNFIFSLTLPSFSLEVFNSTLLTLYPDKALGVNNI